MKLSSQWIRDFVDLPVDDRRLAEDLTNVGISVEGISGSGADTVFEMEIGTNRPDAMNHYGVAREAAAIYGAELKQLSALGFQTSARQTSAAKAASSSASLGTTEVVPFPSGAPGNVAPFPIQIAVPEACPRFSARVIRGATVKPSPGPVAHRLGLLGQRAISNAVDATNYVLWEMGKPTHVFDLDLLEGGELIIRRAKDGEKLKTLDGVERTLTAEDVVVADAKRAVSLAGVMGGYDTMITDKTRNILIESAWWDPATIRKTSRRHGIHTDASHRFERGGDFDSTVISCDRVAQLILDSGGGELAGEVVDVVARNLDQAQIVLRVSEVHRILGSHLDAGEIFRILKKLGFEVIPEGQEDRQFRVHIPSWRLDVEREIDLIEEVARLHGYDRFENTLPSYSGEVVESPHAAARAELRTRALALGYNEALSLTFISHEDAERFASGTRVLELGNPLSEEASVMRTSLVPGMLDMLAWNLNRDAGPVRLFEMGNVYEISADERLEPKRLCLGATLGALKYSQPAGGILDVSKGEQAEVAEAFRSLKGDVETLVGAFAGGMVTLDRETAEYFHRGRSARILLDGAPVAQLGQIAPEVAASRKLREPVFLADIDVEALHRRGLRQVRYLPVGKYPAVERDFSFLFADVVTFAKIEKSVMNLELTELREFGPVEIFRGGSVGAGKYSMLLRAKFQSRERTLREDEVADWSAKIVAALAGLGGMQR
ncbi:MAG TPA: phenylalanine--tRNA ligase subunit beta [Candidatus Sulfotelmatobacter sp.]